MNCEEARELLEAFHDEELTPETRQAVAAHVKTCANCAAALARLDDLRVAIKSVGQFDVPVSLRESVTKLVAQNDLPAVSARRRWTFGALAASHIAVAVLGGAAAYGVFHQHVVRDFDTQELVAAHVRSLMDNRLIQVTSSDTHTVRPWFAGKLSFAPDVRNFDPVNFPLLGGRLDYVDGATVAALVYGHDKHIINVFVSPASSSGSKSIVQSTRNGFTIYEWQLQDLRYRAISDLNPVEMQDFVRKLDVK
jgi:anti-sigma factor RsiW